jgi:hypothetical protein
MGHTRAEMRFFLFVASLLLWLFSCGGRTTLGSLQLDSDASSSDASLPKTDAPAPPPGDSGLRLDGVVLDTCGPADGPGLEVKVGGVGSCDAPVANPGYFVQMDFWAALPTGPGTYSLSSALQCVSAECTYATSATLTFTAYAPTGTDAAGTFSMKMPDGSTLTGTFTAKQCHNGAKCG